MSEPEETASTPLLDAIAGHHGYKILIPAHRKRYQRLPDSVVGEMEAFLSVFG